MIECPVNVTAEDYDAFIKHDAVVVVEYEREDQSRFGQIEAWGDWDEMQDQADTPRLAIVPAGLRIICQKAIRVAELLGKEPCEQSSS